MELDNEIYLKFTQIGRLLQRQFIKNFKKNSAFIDPSRGQGRILKALQIKDGISTKDLAYILGIQVCSLNELLQKLEKNGYISREPSKKDKRVSLIYLTDKGKDIDLDFPKSNEFLDHFSLEEKKELDKYLTQIIKNLQDEEECAPFGGFGPCGFNPMGKHFKKFFDGFPDFF